MILITKFRPPVGYTLYGGADVSSVQVRGGAVYWAASMFLPSTVYGGGLALVIVVQTPQGSTAYIPLNTNNQPLRDARGQFTSLGDHLYFTGIDKTIESKPEVYMYLMENALPVEV
jgi:hypothetical protein